MQISELARTHNSFGHFVAEQVRNPASESQQCVGIHVDADFRRLAEKLTSLPDRCLDASAMLQSLFDWIFWPTVEDWRKEIEMWTDKDREKYKDDGRRYPGRAQTT